jgi:hypothetical protein
VTFENDQPDLIQTPLLGLSIAALGMSVLNKLFGDISIQPSDLIQNEQLPNWMAVGDSSTTLATPSS